METNREETIISEPIDSNEIEKQMILRVELYNQGELKCEKNMN